MNNYKLLGGDNIDDFDEDIDDDCYAFVDEEEPNEEKQHEAEISHSDEAGGNASSVSAPRQDYLKETPAGAFELSEIAGGWRIDRFRGRHKHVVIPAEHEGKPIISIGKGAFKHRRTLDKIVIGDNIKRISKDAFLKCSYLMFIHIGRGVSSLSAECFGECPSLLEITVDERNKKYYAEGNCLIERKAKKLICGCVNSIIPEGVEIIGSYSFSGITSLEQIVIPEGVKTIESLAFSGCAELRSVSLPSSLEYLDGSAFNALFKLTEVRYAGTIVGWWRIGVQFSNVVFCDTRVICRDGELTMPAKLTVSENGYYVRIEENGARGSSGWFRFETVEGGYAVVGYDGTEKEITVPTSYLGKPVTEIGKEAFQKSQIKKLTLPDTLKKIGDNAFNNSNLRSIEIPEGVSFIGDGAFACCFDLRKIVLPRSLRYLGIMIFPYDEFLRVTQYNGSSSEWRQIEKDRSWREAWHGKVWSRADGKYIGLLGRG